MTPRFFIVCNQSDLQDMMRATSPMAYAIYNRLTIVDWFVPKQRADWHKFKELRDRPKCPKTGIIVQR